jgi:hypothetical protein
MEKPMFLFAGTYANIASAEGDHEVIKILHSCDEIGVYDAAVVARSSDDTVSVHKSSLASSTAAEAWLEAWIGQLERGLSRDDATEIRALLVQDRAALVVVGSETDADRIQQTAVEATRATLKHLQSSSPATPFTDR